MVTWFKSKSELQKLQHMYCKLMKSSYKLALKNKVKSDQLHQEADEILSQIKKLEQQD